MSGIFSFWDLVAKAHDPTLAEQAGHVYQVWEDGEITLQKCGPLLWQRNLHMIERGDPARATDWTAWPCKLGNHGYIFTTKERAYRIRAMILGCAVPVEHLQGGF